MAEDLIFHVRWMSGLRREQLGGVALCLMPGDDPRLTKVVRVRLRPDEVEQTLAAVRETLRSEGRTTSTWWLGPRTTPSDLEERLLGYGLVPLEPTTAMIATVPPPHKALGVEVRPLRSEADADVAAAIIAASFDLNHDTETALAEEIREEINPLVADSIKSFLALIDDLPVGTAASVYLDGCVGLIGGSTLSTARGRGVYRALVQARWDDAVAHGTPVLITQAVDATSRPILERMGSAPLFPITILQNTHP